jgi:hypothetical protein
MTMCSAMLLLARRDGEHEVKLMIEIRICKGTKKGQYVPRLILGHIAHKP